MGKLVLQIIVILVFTQAVLVALFAIPVTVYVYGPTSTAAAASGFALAWSLIAGLISAWVASVITE